MVLVWHFSGSLRSSKSLEELESKVENLDGAEHREAGEETHRAAHQPDQLEEKNWANQKLPWPWFEITSSHLMYRHLPIFVPDNLVVESCVEEDAHNLQLCLNYSAWGNKFH